MSSRRTDNELRFAWPAERQSSAESPAGAAPGASPAGAAVQASGANRAAAPRRLLTWAGYAAAWCTVLALGAIAVLHVVDHDGTFPLIWLNSFTRYLYLPAYACLAWGVWQRRWVLASAAGAIVAAHVAWMFPDFVRDGRFDVEPMATTRAADPSPTLRVFFANVAARNTEHESLLREIEAAKPDVIVLVEFSWPWHIAFKAAPVMAPYKYGAGWLQSHIGSVNVFSKLPLENEMQRWIVGRAVHSVDVRLGERTLRVVGLHGPRPLGTPMHNYRAYWEEMIPLLAGEHGPVVVVGDFNATEHSRVYRQLTAGRLRSAHEDRGRGYAVTWPNGQFLLPPIRIDQALVSPQVECVQIEEGVGRGSDHKPLILDVRVREVEADEVPAPVATAATALPTAAGPPPDGGSPQGRLLRTEGTWFCLSGRRGNPRVEMSWSDGKVSVQP